MPRPPGPRYERGRPNELWHVDLKGPFFINLGRTYIKTWIAGLVDDHSRFVIGLRILTEAKAVPIVLWMDECFELCGRPLELMSDNGKPFVGWLPGLLSRFGKRLEELHIRHLRTQITSPWTNGKIEAFIKGYNDLVNFFKKEQSFDTTTKQAGSLLGDSTTNLIRHKLAGLLDIALRQHRQKCPAEQVRIARVELENAAVIGRCPSGISFSTGVAGCQIAAGSVFGRKLFLRRHLRRKGRKAQS